MNRCYLVELKPDQRQRLTSEVLGLATCLRGEGGEWLLFRDNLVAYKVAKLTGGTVRCGQLLAGSAPDTPDTTSGTTSPRPTPRDARPNTALPKRAAAGDTLTLEGGVRVRLETPVAV